MILPGKIADALRLVQDHLDDLESTIEDELEMEDRQLMSEQQVKIDTLERELVALRAANTELRRRLGEIHGKGR